MTIPVPPLPLVWGGFCWLGSCTRARRMRARTSRSIWRTAAGSLRTHHGGRAHQFAVEAAAVNDGVLRDVAIVARVRGLGCVRARQNVADQAAVADVDREVERI